VREPLPAHDDGRPPSPPPDPRLHRPPDLR